jgi:hypothetical protein
MIIFIDVSRDDIEVPKRDDDDDTETLKKGTFREPFPLVRIKPGTHVEWRIRQNGNAHTGDIFVVGFTFAEGSPFEDNVTLISNRTGPKEATAKGLFHYTLIVIDGQTGTPYSIGNCPILEVNDN